MVTKKVRFNSVDDVKNFCNAAGHCEFNMDLASGRYLVDAKSLMGILSLSLDKSVNLQIQVDTEDECAKFLQNIDFCLCK